MFTARLFPLTHLRKQLQKQIATLKIISRIYSAKVVISSKKIEDLLNDLCNVITFPLTSREYKYLEYLSLLCHAFKTLSSDRVDLAIIDTQINTLNNI